MKSIHIDASSVSTINELHEVLAEKLGFFDGYGHNWDAFWDCITSPELSAMPEMLEISGMDTFAARFPAAAQCLRDCLIDLQKERPEIIVKWVD